MSTLRDAHVSHNSIPGPQGVQPSGETAPVMGRISHHHARIAIDWTPVERFGEVLVGHPGEITRTWQAKPKTCAKQNLKPRANADIRCVAVWSLGAPHGKPPPARPVRVSRSGVMGQRRARPRALAEAG